MMGCLDDLTITNLVGNALPEPERVAALAHLDECRACSELVGAVGTPREPATLARLAPGTHVGRFIIERVAGAGAMGVVYAARDSTLDRTVAIKCMAAAGARDRMLREAKAMAQLSHRNVVSIFEVGTVGDDVFLAMELVRGRTLREWVGGRSVSEIVGVLVEAARGIAAAHDAGIVHRDIKPDNILIADDGRVCVTDFGLARAADASVEPTPIAHDAPRNDEPVRRSAAAPAREPGGALGPAGAVDTLTATGQIVGTPVYMAPEQLAGAPGDERCDQFAFCVVAYECLAGRRPFAGRTLAELRDAIARGAAPIARLPAWLARVIDRGLAADPARRFATMHALVAELARDRARRLRWFAIGGLVVVAAGVGLAIPRGRTDACPDPRDRLTGTWDAARRTQLERAFAAHPRPFTAAMLAHATRAFDRYADQWVVVRSEMCRATYERRDQSEARYDAELACLERRRGELASAVEVLTNAPDEQTVRSAAAVVDGLPDLRVCREGAQLKEQPPLPIDPTARAQIDALYRGVATATALARTTKYQAAQTLIDGLLPRARAIAYAPLLAEALYLHGKLQMATRDAKTAERALDEAATFAAAAKDDVLAARIWIQRAYTVGALARRFPEAATLAGVARAAVQRAGDRAELLVDWHSAVGATLAQEEKYEEALPHYREALALAEKAAPTRLSDQLGKLATVLDASGHYAEARAPAERAVALMEKELGPDHPDLAFTLDALAAIYYDQGQFADAQRTYRRALAILDKLGDPTSYDATEAIEGLGITAYELGQLDEARAQHERVLKIRQQIAPDDPHVADSLLNLGMVLAVQGHLKEARAHYERGLAIYRSAYGPNSPQVALALRQRAQLEMGTQQAITDLNDALAITTAAFGPEHPEVAVEHGNLGSAYMGLRRWKDAQQHYERAIALHEKTVGATHDMTAKALTGLGQAMLEQHDNAKAITIFERALAIHDRNHAPPATKGVPRWFLARALWNSDRTRALALAAEARRELADARDPTSVAARTELDAWLAKRR